MGYMSRLGLWGEEKLYKEFGQFASSINQNGVTGLEMVQMNLKSYGVLSCRSLSYYGTEFETVACDLEEANIRVYDRCCRVITLLRNALVANL